MKGKRTYMIAAIEKLEKKQEVLDVESGVPDFCIDRTLN